MTAVSRAWRARGGGLEYGLLRRPFRRELRAHLAQCLNQWLLWALVGAAIIAGTFANVPGAVAIGFGLPLPELIPYRPLVVVLGVAAFATAVLALGPRRRVQVATNVLAAICSAFLAVQLARIHTPEPIPFEHAFDDLPPWLTHEIPGQAYFPVCRTPPLPEC